MKQIQLAAAIAALLGTLSGGVALGVKATAAVQKHLDDDARRDEQIRVLQTIAISEHPAYSPMIFPKGER